MARKRLSISIAIGFITAAMAFPLACIRTEHKIETTHKIEAHIVIDIRRIQAEAQSVESYVRDEDAAPSTRGPQSMIISESKIRMVASRSLWSVFDLASSAAAQTPDEEQRAKDRRKERSKTIDETLTTTCVGENRMGYLELRPCDAAEEAAEKARLERLRDEENMDRKIIYAAVALREGLQAEQADLIGEIFAVEIRKKLKKGQSFQVPSRDDLYEEFLNSPLGKALGGPKKEAWVVMPEREWDAQPKEI